MYPLAGVGEIRELRLRETKGFAHGHSTKENRAGVQIWVFGFQV